MALKSWLVEGGRPLRGAVAVGGAKNAAFKAMIAALLGREETLLENVPEVGDVERTAEMIRILGASVRRVGPNALQVDPRGLRSATLPADLARRSRASLLFAGPLLARSREVELPLPGGDRIGRRPLDRALAGLRAMGAEVEPSEGGVRLRADGLRGARFRFPKSTHTGTEALVLAGLVARGRTVLENAAQEPEVDDLLRMLAGMGARARRVAPRRIEIEGGRALRGTRHRILPDRNEAVSFACMALATIGEIRISPVDRRALDSFLRLLTRLGAGWEVLGKVLHVGWTRPLRPIEVETRPHPGVMTDWQPLLVTLLTQAWGTSVVHETVFENRFGYVPDLLRMGARIELFSPPVAHPAKLYGFNPEDDRPGLRHAARIEGPTALRATEAAVSDVRAGATLLMAALAARGETAIAGIEHVERGYERFADRLRSLGASVREREAEPAPRTVVPARRWSAGTTRPAGR
ncbi:MAG: UDP-N-acetylglucosamine 1-carboxyvinyltransferase [Planctomycetes bacterium]|nr:UDP-N-acetylglucosamine 1-carboxyvinyltransferase [Planctomycetota bacterium]